MNKVFYFLLCLCFNFASAQESLFSKVADMAGIKAALPCNCQYQASVDLSQKMPPVQNQNNIQSCVGWSLGYACRSYYHKVLDKADFTNKDTLVTSNVVSPFFIYNSLNNQKNVPINLLRAINFLKDTGACSLHMMPNPDYSQKPNAGQIKAAADFKIYSYRKLGSDYGVVPQEEIKSALLCGDPVLVAIRRDSTFFTDARNNPSKAVWKTYKKLSSAHAVVIVGYDDKQGLFKFMNSQGPEWGANGFGWISYKIAGNVMREAYVIKADRPWYATLLGKGLDSLPKADILIDSVVSQNLKLTLEEKDPFSTSDGRMVMKIEMANKNPLVNTMCQNWKVVVRFFILNAQGKTQPLINAGQNNKLANGQVAFNGRFADGIACAWKANVFYSDLFPKNKQNKKKQKTTLRAEPVLYIDNAPVASGNQVDVVVEH